MHKHRSQALPLPCPSEASATQSPPTTLPHRAPLPTYLTQVRILLVHGGWEPVHVVLEHNVVLAGCHGLLQVGLRRGPGDSSNISQSVSTKRNVCDGVTRSPHATTHDSLSINCCCCCLLLTASPPNMAEELAAAPTYSNVVACVTLSVSTSKWLRDTLLAKMCKSWNPRQVP